MTIHPHSQRGAGGRASACRGSEAQEVSRPLRRHPFRMVRRSTPADEDTARREAFSEGELVETGDTTNVTECDVEEVQS